MNRLPNRRLAAALGTMLFAGAVAAAPVWHVTDLGPLKARDDKVSGINAAGVVVGTYGNLGAVFDHGTITRIHGMGGPRAQALGINDAGTVVGWGHDETYAELGFTWTGGKPKALPNLGGRDATAYAINQAGVATGGADVEIGYPHAVLYRDGQAIDLGMPEGAVLAEGMGIDEAGDVVGRALASPGYVPFAFRNGAMQILDLSQGANMQAWAVGINNVGTIVGTQYDNHGILEAVTWDDAGLHVLLEDAEGNGINDSNHVVGEVDGHGFFNDGRKTFQLDRHLDAASAGWQIDAAGAINADDAIAATGTLGGRTVHALLLTRVR